MKSRKMGGVLAGIAVFACLVLPMTALGQKFEAGGFSAVKSVLEEGNTIYRIFIQDDPASGKLGTFAPGTGSGHPKPLKNIFFGAYYPS
ncbi:MAG: hypothetical protein KJ645_11995, partial [Planctomycetes bacterium]|nr:hypothetical protein [Planctomycetota bacterium]